MDPNPNDTSTWPVAKNLTVEAIEHGRLAALDLLHDPAVMDLSTLHFRGGAEMVRRGCDDSDHRRQMFEGAFFGTIFGMLA